MSGRGAWCRTIDADAITDVLFGRLGDADVSQVIDGLEATQRAMWDAASERDRRRMTLSFGLLNGVPAIAEHTGLSAATPPNDVHSMVHGWVTEIGGSYYLADLVQSVLQDAGQSPGSGARVLDFSCSTGRVVRPMAAAYPDVDWRGCDPNAQAIAWMDANVPGVDVFVSSTVPPLPVEDASLDLVFAISVWSHYSAKSALEWLWELYRVVCPGGHVLLTTHGLQSCVWFTNNPDAAIDQRLGARWIDTTTQRLQDTGHCFWDVFGRHGDWGVVDPEWGLAFFTPEWLLNALSPAWAVRTYRIGGAHGNQDVYLLQRH